MKTKDDFLKNVCNLAIPVALQCMLQSSFSIVDQIMIGQLGSTNIAAVGLAGKFSSIYSVLVSAIASVAGIMIAQYMGKKNDKEVNRSLCVNLVIAGLLALLFTGICMGFSSQVMGIYTMDSSTKSVAAQYLRIVALTFLPYAGSSLLATMLRCMEKASFPLYATIAAALVNTLLNYILIFGKLGFSPMGVKGAAIATVIAQFTNFFTMLFAFVFLYKKRQMKMNFVIRLGKERRLAYLAMLLPILATEFLWSLGENAYTAIYGHIGTKACAAMTLTIPIQCLMIGGLSGLSQAAAIIIGKLLGKEEYDQAYHGAKRLMYYGFVGSIGLSILLFLFSHFYVDIYQVEDQVKSIAVQILFAFALISPVKVQNMILGGGIIRSGGKTKYVMMIDCIGTWGFGVPLGLLAAFVFDLSIPYVYFILSLEECVRFGLSLRIFKKRKWINSLKN